MSVQDFDQRIYPVASQQAGYVTTCQAEQVGISRRQLAHYAQRGRLLRIRSGLYRLAFFPAQAHEDLFAAWLTVGEQAVVSHDSALSLYELCDALPREVHLTVPRTNSRRHPHLRLHTNALLPGDVTHFAGLPVTTVPRTLADVATTGLAEELVIQAIQQSIHNGLTTPKELLDMAERYSERVRRLFRFALGVFP